MLWGSLAEHPRPQPEISIGTGIEPDTRRPRVHPMPSHHCQITMVKNALFSWWHWIYSDIPAAEHMNISTLVWIVENKPYPSWTQKTQRPKACSFLPKLRSWEITSHPTSNLRHPIPILAPCWPDRSVVSPPRTSFARCLPGRASWPSDPPWALAGGLDGTDGDAGDVGMIPGMIPGMMWTSPGRNPGGVFIVFQIPFFAGKNGPLSGSLVPRFPAGCCRWSWWFQPGSSAPWGPLAGRHFPIQRMEPPKTGHLQLNKSSNPGLSRFHSQFQGCEMVSSAPVSVDSFYSCVEDRFNCVPWNTIVVPQTSVLCCSTQK